MADYLLDSDVLIWVLRGRPETVRLLERLREESADTLACSALNLMEIWAGARPSEEKRTSLLLDALRAVPVDAAVARRAAGLLAKRRMHRDPHQWIDAVIAATCLEHGLTLVTYNRKDFPYPEIKILDLID